MGDPLAPTPPDTFIAPGCRIIGTVTASGHVRVEGSVDGAVRARSVTIGPSGRLEGSLQARDAIVAGRVDGDAHATHHLRVLASSALTGSLRCRRLVLEAGAHFDGRADVAPEPPPTPEEGALQLV